MESELYKELQEVFRQVFTNPELTISKETSNNDIDGWTSLTHAILLSETEKKFNISFDIMDMLSMHSVSDIIKKIAEKKS